MQHWCRLRNLISNYHIIIIPMPEIRAPEEGFLHVISGSRFRCDGSALMVSFRVVCILFSLGGMLVLLVQEALKPAVLKLAQLLETRSPINSKL